MEYTAGAAARAVGISVASVRGYSARFAQFLSPTASPGPGKPRVLTDDDLRVMRFVFYYTGQGESWDDVAARLARGEVAAFDWTPTPAATLQIGTIVPKINMLQRSTGRPRRPRPVRRRKNLWRLPFPRS